MLFVVNRAPLIHFLFFPIIFLYCPRLIQYATSFDFDFCEQGFPYSLM